MAGHALCGIMGLAMVSGGFWTLIASTIYIGMLYSIYMALHSWMVWLYLFLLGLNVLSGVFDLLFMIADGWGFIIFAAILGFYIMALRKMYVDSSLFRIQGANAGKLGDVAGTYIESGIKSVGKNIGNQIKAKAGEQPGAVPANKPTDLESGPKAA